MSVDDLKRNNENQESDKREVTERKSFRFLMLFYDSLLYLFCWIAVLIMHPSSVEALPFLTSLFYFVIGFVSFFGIRFVFRCYRLIWRYGSIRVISREFFSDLLAFAVLFLSGMFFSKSLFIFEISMVTLASFGAIYVVISLAARILYTNLYHFAEKDSFLSRILRRVFEKMLLVDFSSKEAGAVLATPFSAERLSGAPINELQNIAERFAIRGNIQNIKQINTGYINRTYRVETLSDSGKIHLYTLQRINTNVFPDVESLMNNFKVTTEHLSKVLRLPGNHIRGSVPTLRPTLDGKNYLQDNSGYWRVLTHFDKVYSLDIPTSPELFYNVGVAFGRFLEKMSDIDVDQIIEVVPNFHNTVSRYQDLEKAILRNVKCRAEDVEEEIAFVRERSHRFGIISEALEKGIIPRRICHNDTNLNNILFDCKTDLPVAIIDLDTVMPSSPLYDFGDSMRIGTNTAKDDEKDLSKVSCNLQLYKAYARGYLEACGSILTEEELGLMPYAPLIITMEDGIRFLADHINGDTYYNIFYPGQNIDRAKTQFKLVEDMERKISAIKEIHQKIYKELGLEVDLSQYHYEVE